MKMGASPNEWCLEWKIIRMIDDLGVPLIFRKPPYGAYEYMPSIYAVQGEAHK